MGSASPDVTADARVTPFEGRAGLRTATGSGHAAVPSLPPSRLSFSREGIEEARQEVALMR